MSRELRPNCAPSCSWGGFLEAAKLLVEKGADPVSDNLKRTSMHWAAMGPPPSNHDCCKLYSMCPTGKHAHEADKVLHGWHSNTGPSARRRGAHLPTYAAAPVVAVGLDTLHSAAGTGRAGSSSCCLTWVRTSVEDEDGLTAYDQAKKEGHSEVIAILPVCNGSGSGGGGAKPMLQGWRRGRRWRWGCTISREVDAAALLSSQSLVEYLRARARSVPCCLRALEESPDHLYFYVALWRRWTVVGAQPWH